MFGPAARFLRCCKVVLMKVFRGLSLLQASAVATVAFPTSYKGASQSQTCSLKDKMYCNPCTASTQSARKSKLSGSLVLTLSSSLTRAGGQSDLNTKAKPSSSLGSCELTLARGPSPGPSHQPSRCKTRSKRIPIWKLGWVLT